jgi:Bacterial SH3 domain
MRQAANMQARTNAYLMDNDAVIISSPESGWVKSQGAQIAVTDTQENIVEAKSEGKARGYIASKYLRNPNTSDLVRIEQADHAYWSDIARVKVSHMVNVRSHPWYTSKIVTTLKNNTPLYIISTVDNWSLVRSDDGSIAGYIRSDFLTVDRAQRVDNPLTGKSPSPQVSPIESSTSENSWIGF